jgi:glycosyltransferase involved in cell wall biosynthesis
MLHILESFAPGGMETTFLNVLRHFKDADGTIQHDVLAFAGGALENEYRQAADEITVGCDAETFRQRLSVPYDLAYILFDRCAYRLLPELVSRTAMPVVYGKGYDLGGMYRLNEGLRWQADESMLAACDGVTFTTANLAGGFDLPVGRTTILGKAADVARFQSIPAPPPPSTPQRIVCLANLHPRKRLGDLVHALVRVRRDVPHAELHLVGGGNDAEAARLRELADSLGVAGAVTLTGRQADVAPALEDARVVALPSSCEGVPTALLEGMAAGRPVVATAVGHVASIVDQGKEGFLVPAGDVDALGDAITELLLNPALAAAMGQAARARSAEHDVRVVARRLLRALRTCTAHAA